VTANEDTVFAASYLNDRVLAGDMGIARIKNKNSGRAAVGLDFYRRAPGRSVHPEAEHDAPPDRAYPNSLFASGVHQMQCGRTPTELGYHFPVRVNNLQGAGPDNFGVPLGLAAQNDECE